MAADDSAVGWLVPVLSPDGDQIGGQHADCVVKYRARRWVEPFPCCRREVDEVLSCRPPPCPADRCDLIGAWVLTDRGMSTGPAILLSLITELEFCRMVIIGVDPHKDVLVAVAVDGNGRQLGLRDAAARPRGFKALLSWVGQFEQRLWAVEDVRHVAGGFVRFLLAAGEAVVWVPTQMSSEYRKRVRASGSPTRYRRAGLRPRGPGRGSSRRGARH